MRQVKGVLFADYVRMIRATKGVDFAPHLSPEDLPYLRERIDVGAWYPMETFERLGNAILRTIAKSDMTAVRAWGRLSVDQLRAQQPALVSEGDPVETLNRFRVLRSTFFDFDALKLLFLHEDETHIVVHYHMGMPAEEAASQQTMGFFERLIELGGATDVEPQFRQRSWAGDERTLLEVRWTPPGHRSSR